MNPHADIHPVAMTVPSRDRQLAGREKVSALSRLARQALHYSAVYGGWSLGALTKDKDGVPLPSNGIHWSLSHKETLVTAVAAPFAIGIDVEKIRPVTPRLFQRVAVKAEWDLAGGAADLPLFFRFWTAKEAVLKAVGRGIAGLGHCRVATIPDNDRMTLFYNTRVWTVTHHRIDADHLIAVTAEPERIRWHLMGGAPA
jgi:4'-phosphopantetheinyl transferase